MRQQRNKSLVIFVVLFTLLFSVAEAAHIVFLQLIATYSHRIPQWPVVKSLLSRGHTITYLTGIHPAPTAAMTHPNLTDVFVPEVAAFMDFTADKFDINYRIYGIQPPMVLSMFPIMYFGCKAFLQSPKFQEWLTQKPKVDLIFSDVDFQCSFGLANHLKAKHAIFQTLPPYMKQYDSLGLPWEPVTPTWEGVHVKAPLGFLERVVQSVNSLAHRAQEVLYYDLFFKPVFNEVFKEAPDLYEMEKNTSLFLVNGDYLEDYPKAVPPLVVKVPGIHIKSKEELDKESFSDEVVNFLKDHNSYDGLVFLSFGTVASAPKLPAYFREIFMQTIQSFPRIKFIWRWKGDKPESYPKNLLLTGWVNQQKVFAHPKIKAFITQAGRPSMQEAFYHKVPTIAFPILGDQDFNAHKFQYLGTCKVLEIAGFTKQELTDAINEVLSEEFKARITALSDLGLDTQVSSRDKAVWWTEFILRHTHEELNLMKPLGQDLSWWKKRGLDVWLFLLVLVIIMGYGKLRILKFIWLRVKNRKRSSNVSKKVKSN